MILTNTGYYIVLIFIFFYKNVIRQKYLMSYKNQNVITLKQVVYSKTVFRFGITMWNLLKYR